MSRWLRAAGVSTEVQKGHMGQKGQKAPIGTENPASVPFVPFVLTSKGLTPNQLDAMEERAAIIHEAHIIATDDDGKWAFVQGTLKIVGEKIAKPHPIVSSWAFAAKMLRMEPTKGGI